MAPNCMIPHDSGLFLTGQMPIETSDNNSHIRDRDRRENCTQPSPQYRRVMAQQIVEIPRFRWPSY